MKLEEMYRYGYNKRGRTTTRLDSTRVDGQEVKVGDYVGFKSDIEQGGRITKITDGPYGVQLHLASGPEGFEGGYIGGDTETVIDARDAWID